MTTPAASTFRLAIVPGVTPAKWVRTFAQRRPEPLELLPCDNTAHAIAQLSDGVAHAALVREPPASTPNSISLYDETTVAVVGKDHLFTAATEVSVIDLADEPLLIPLDDPLTWDDRPGAVVEHRPPTVSDAIELVAAGVGVLLVPMSLARLHHRRDITFRPVRRAPTTPVALVWAESSPAVEEFIGVVRGRRANSSRGQSAPAPKRSAKEKMLAKRAAREAAGKTPKSSKRGRPRHR
ncbi:LysR family transcriptional regulator [Gordonia sp. TBRC 11910]|uniref:LysR family transcriptional regulator n=1 Tax=Gordonia asplenii TaxID=2725283 RepID=A0A848L307_9ACTN|nr:LysR substrate-binding domain-containing protein [Gordonia asplenii]NMO02941.1 LysR family transcriptional regulator [Gordonia asplenii]